MEASHPPLNQLQTLLPGARRIELTYTDLEDGSLAALKAHPEPIVDPRRHRLTSYFERLERHHPDELRHGLERIRRELEHDRAPKRPGKATVLAYAKTRPASSAHSSAAR